MELSFLKTGTTFADLNLKGNFSVLKDWLKMWAKTPRIDSGNPKDSKKFKRDTNAPRRAFGFYSINYAFNFLGSNRINKKGTMVVEISKGSSRWELRRLVLC